jgi:AraC-like DNA-binding protein
MTRHLGHMMLLQMLRQYLEAQASHPVGWLFALADPRLRAAIEAMHAQPAQRWTLPQLAAVAGQSRSAFALHFRNRVGVTPLDYLLRWRMRLATRRLKDSAATVTSIAQALGYDSDSAFSHAFKRGHGVLAAPVPAAPRGRAGVAAWRVLTRQGQRACTGGSAAAASKANGPRNRPMPNHSPRGGRAGWPAARWRRQTET